MSVGRGVWRRKTQVDECWLLDMSAIKENVKKNELTGSTIKWSSTFGRRAGVGVITLPDRNVILLYYALETMPSRETEDIRTIIHLDSTPCYYGGRRHWFLCPHCHRRCRILYLPFEARYFACRICYNLTYATQQEGRPRWKIMQDAAFRYPKWLREYTRTRSEKKRQRLLKKLERLDMGLQSIVNWGKKLKK